MLDFGFGWSRFILANTTLVATGTVSIIEQAISAVLFLSTKKDIILYRLVAERTTVPVQELLTANVENGTVIKKKSFHTRFEIYYYRF